MKWTACNVRLAFLGYALKRLSTAAILGAVALSALPAWAAKTRMDFWEDPGGNVLVATVFAVIASTPLWVTTAVLWFFLVTFGPPQRRWRWIASAAGVLHTAFWCYQFGDELYGYSAYENIATFWSDALFMLAPLGAALIAALSPRLADRTYRTIFLVSACMAFFGIWASLIRHAISGIMLI